MAFISGHALERQRHAFAIWRSRGWSWHAIWRLLLLETSALAVPAVPAGLALAWLASVLLARRFYGGVCSPRLCCRLLPWAWAWRRPSWRRKPTQPAAGSCSRCDPVSLALPGLALIFLGVALLRLLPVAGALSGLLARRLPAAVASSSSRGGRCSTLVWRS